MWGESYFVFYALDNNASKDRKFRNKLSASCLKQQAEHFTDFLHGFSLNVRPLDLEGWNIAQSLLTLKHNLLKVDFILHN